jgi:hypothetical protein
VKARSREPFLTVVGGTSVTSPCKAPRKARARTAAPEPEPDAKIIAAGERVEALLEPYFIVHRNWARRSEEAHRRVNAKFAADDWEARIGPDSPASVLLFAVLRSNGHDAASEALEILNDKIQPLADLIADASITTLGGLRAKTLVALWDSIPGNSDHEGYLKKIKGRRHWQRRHGNAVQYISAALQLRYWERRRGAQSE